MFTIKLSDGVLFGLGLVLSLNLMGGNGKLKFSKKRLAYVIGPDGRPA